MKRRTFLTILMVIASLTILFGQNATIVLEEDFSGIEVGEIPTGWTSSHTYWGVSDSNEAGGEAPEMRLWTSVYGTFRLETPALDVSDLSNLELVFKQKLDDLDDPGPYTISVQVSVDGVNWTTEWSYVDPANIQPEIRSINLDPYAGEEEFYISWLFDGDGGDLDFWWIDDIIVYEPTPYPGEALLVYPEDEAEMILTPVSLEWIKGISADPTGYELYLGTTNPPPFLVDVGGDTTYLTDELEYNTTYYWQIVPYNNEGSPPECPVWSFTTGPNPEISIPHFENFDSVETPDIPYSWRKIVESTSTVSKIVTISYSSPHSPPNHVQITSNNLPENNVILITPPVEEIGESRIKFWLRSTYLPNQGDFFVGTITDPYDASTFTIFETITPADLSTSYQEFIVSFEDYTGTDQYIAFKHSNLGNYSTTFYLDDFLLENLPGDPILLLSPEEFPFIAVEGGSSPAVTFTLINDGSGTLAIQEEDLQFSGDDADDFALVDVTFPIFIAEDSSVDIEMVFSPDSPGSKSATLEIAYNGPDSPYTTQLSGEAYPSGTALFGIGDDVSSATEGPLNIFFANQRAQMVYTADEILASGHTGPGVITDFGYYVESAPETAITNFQLKMKHTTDSNVSSHDQNFSDSHIVYYNSSYMPEEGYDLLELDEPFVWNGIDNIKVEMIFSGVDPTSQSGITRIYNHPVTAGYRSVRSQTGNVSNAYTNQIRNWKPQAMMLLDEGPSTPWPVVTDISDFYEFVFPGETETAQFTLSNAGSQDLVFNIGSDEYPGLITANPALGYILPGEQATIELTFAPAGLEAGIYYPDLVIEHNGISDDLLIPCEIRVLPETVYIMEDFSGSWPPSGWTRTSTLDEVNWKRTNTAAAGRRYPEACFDTTPLALQAGTQRLITPPLDTSGNTNIHLEFHHAHVLNYGNVELMLETTSDGDNWNTIATFPSETFGANLFQAIINNEDVGSENFQIAWTFVGDSFFTYGWYIDEIMIAGGEENGTIAGTVNLLGGDGDVTDVSITDGDVTVNPGADGSYSLNLYPGNYYIAATLEGYVNSVVYDITVEEGETTNLDIDLEWIAPVLYPPNDFAAGVQDYNSVLLGWEEPGVGTEELYHHTGYTNLGIGTGEPVDFIVAARFTADELAEYYGDWELTGVNIILHSMDFDYVAIQVYEGGSFGDPGTLVYEEDITNTIIAQNWVEHILTTPVQLVEGNEYWLAYDISATGDHPAACDEGPAVAGKGDWMYENGVWVEMSVEYGLDANWIINGVISETHESGTRISSNTKKLGNRAIESTRSAYDRYNRYPLTFDLQAGESNISFSSRSRRELTGYTIYRNEDMIDSVDENSLEYLDTGLPAGDFLYTVVANYTEGDSNPTPAVEISITLPAPVDVNATSDVNDILIEWELPGDSRGIESFNIYQDETFVANSDSLSYRHEDVPDGTYIYNVAIVFSGDNEGEWSEDVEVIHETTSAEDPSLIPAVTELKGNYPNPFNPDTTIEFALDKPGRVKLVIFNIKGEKVKTLLNDHLEAAHHSIIWNGQDDRGRTVGSGVFFYRMVTRDFTDVRKMIMIK